MNPLSLFSQIAAVILALIISIFYVQPTFVEIGEIQADIIEYQDERKKVEAINSQLDGYMRVYDSISLSDKRNLATYLPRSVDDIAVMRDLSFIIAQAGLTNTGIDYQGALNQAGIQRGESGSALSKLGEQAATPHVLNIGVQGTYTQIKDFFGLLETNHYPLEVRQLQITSDDFGLMSAEITLYTYADSVFLTK